MDKVVGLVRAMATFLVVGLVTGWFIDLKGILATVGTTLLLWGIWAFEWKPDEEDEPKDMDRTEG